VLVLKNTINFIHKRLPHKRHVLKIKQDYLKLFKALQNPACLRTGDMDATRGIKFYPYLGLIKAIIAIIVDVGIFFENII